MALDLTLDYRLRWNDFDRFGRISPASTLDILQDIATIHALDMNIGRDNMLAQGVFWAIVRMKYEVMTQPEQDVVQVRTWPHTPSKFSFLRDFSIKGEDGTLLIKASSEWVLMNFETRKFESVLDHMDASASYCEDRAFEKKPKKVAPLKELHKPLLTLSPRPSDIDVNGHVNNARYPLFVMDALDLSEDQEIRTFQIDYRYEVAPTDTLSIYAQENDGAIITAGVIEDGTVAFNCKIELR